MEKIAGWEERWDPTSRKKRETWGTVFTSLRFQFFAVVEDLGQAEQSQTYMACAYKYIYFAICP